MAAILEARELTKNYDGGTVLDVAQLSVSEGETLSVLGPSGAGKSVLLRLLDLLEAPTSGSVLFEGKEVQGLVGKQRLDVCRRMVMIFQDPLLFKGSVADNVAYGLKVRGVPREDRVPRVKEALRLVGIADLERKYVTTLSGGEAQRVALARALVVEPEVLLLDEPFASVDPLNRQALQRDVRAIFREGRRTAIFVTHDQEEAARMGDRIAVLEGGRIVQQGPPREVFYQPRTEFVARFMGAENILSGEVVRSSGGIAEVEVEGVSLDVMTDRSVGERIGVALRPEDVTLLPASEAGSRASSRNSLEGEVVGVELLGPRTRVTLLCPFPLNAVITRRSLEEMDIRPGSRLIARFKATAAHVLDGEGVADEEGRP